MKTSALMVILAVLQFGCSSLPGAVGSAASGLPSCPGAAQRNQAPTRAPASVTLFPHKAYTDELRHGAKERAWSAQLDQTLESLLKRTGAPALAAALWHPEHGLWTQTIGLARVSPAVAADSSTAFYWGSVGKTLTAVLVLQLKEEGRLNLDDPLANWFPQMTLAHYITLGQLLTHTSGLDAYVANDPGTGNETIDLETRATSTPVIFCPGTRAAYSNAGYTLLALVIERIEQQAFHEVVQRRIAQPLGLSSLRAFQPGESQVATLASPHEQRESRADPLAWQRLGSGNVIATSSDMVKFWHALLSAGLLRPETVLQQWSELHALQNLPDTAQASSWYGQGVMLVDLHGAHPSLWLTHLGGVPGANAVVLYEPASQAFVAVAVNSAVSAPAVASALLRVVAP